MDYSRFVFLLARQRSGTNALRSILETHPKIFCHPEVFSSVDTKSRYAALREANFFNFVSAYGSANQDVLLPTDHENLFLDFLEYLGCFSSKPIVVIDVKYNTTHFLTEPFKWPNADSDSVILDQFDVEPYLFRLIKTYKLRVLNLKRRNYLRYHLSNKKAERTGLWHLHGSAARRSEDMKITLDVGDLLRVLRWCLAQDLFVERYFSGSDLYREYEYEKIFTAHEGTLAHGFVDDLSRWLDIDGSFASPARFHKQSYLPLEETIENFNDVAEALRGTEFEYCLQDEHTYSSTNSRPNRKAG